MRRFAAVAVLALAWPVPVPAQVVFVPDGSFETPALPFNSFVTDPTGVSWTFNQHSGIINHSTGWEVGGVPAADGLQVAYIQSANPGSLFGSVIGMISEPITLPVSGNYHLSYALAGRSGPSGEGGHLPFTVYLDLTPIGSDMSETGMPFQYRTVPFNAAAGTYTLRFQGFRPVPDPNVFQDNTAFLDDISITVVPEPSAFALVGLAAAALAGRRTRVGTSVARAGAAG
jgi:hypothetical protein